MAMSQALEVVDVAEHLGDSHVEDEVAEGDKVDWCPTMAALEAVRRCPSCAARTITRKRKKSWKRRHISFFLCVDLLFLLQYILEVELDDGDLGRKNFLS